MPETFRLFIAHYGYFAIFILILSQELGVPIPLPNEFLLMFSGYLAFTGVFNLPLAIIVPFAASVFGAWILFGLFYTFGNWIMHKDRKIPLPRAAIERLSQKIEKREFWAVFLGRVIPFGRGYICIAAGLFELSPKKFALSILASDTLWNAGFVTLGFFAGPYWEIVAAKMGGIIHLVGIVIAVMLGIMIYGAVKNKKPSPKAP